MQLRRPEHRTTAIFIDEPINIHTEYNFIWENITRQNGKTYKPTLPDRGITAPITVYIESTVYGDSKTIISKALHKVLEELYKVYARETA